MLQNGVADGLECDYKHTVSVGMLFSNVSIGTVPGREKTMPKSEFVSKVI